MCTDFKLLNLNVFNRAYPLDIVYRIESSVRFVIYGFVVYTTIGGFVYCQELRTWGGIEQFVTM